MEFLASSEAELVLVNLEDLGLEPEPGNGPGMPDRSWRQRFRLSLEEIREGATVERILKIVNERRRQVHGDST